jgi:hypothetical protein
VLYLVHGFPGDNPVGIVVDINKKILTSVGELAQNKYTTHHAKEISAWYESITMNACDYKDDFWYADRVAH